MAPLRSTMFPPSNPDSRLSWEYEEKGQSTSGIWSPSINLAYTCAADEHFDIHVIVNWSAMCYTVNQHPILSWEDPRHPVVDWKAAPTASWKESRASFAVMADLRWKWFRRDWCTLYSSLGLGFPIARNTRPTPYFSPIGFRAGGKHFYGLIELNLSSASTLGHAGIGYRF